MVLLSLYVVIFIQKFGIEVFNLKESSPFGARSFVSRRYVAKDDDLSLKRVGDFMCTDDL